LWVSNHHQAYKPPCFSAFFEDGAAAFIIFTAAFETAAALFGISTGGYENFKDGG
jgi:hypothetical protein